MMEIITRKFRIGEGEDNLIAIDVIRRMPGFHRIIDHTTYDVTAEFKARII